MRFKLVEVKDEEQPYFYSLPKGFKIPKWNGRTPIATPEFDYWQEE